MKTISETTIVLFNADTDFCIGYEPGDRLIPVLEITGIPVSDGEYAQVIVDRVFRWLNSDSRPLSGALRSLSVGDVVVLVPGGGLQPKAYAINFLGSEGLPFASCPGSSRRFEWLTQEDRSEDLDSTQPRMATG